MTTRSQAMMGNDNAAGPRGPSGLLDKAKNAISKRLSPDTKLGLKVGIAHIKQGVRGAKGVKNAMASDETKRRIEKAGEFGAKVGAVKGGIKGSIQGIKSGLVLAKEQGDKGKSKYETVKRVVKLGAKAGANAGAAEGMAKSAAKATRKIASKAFKDANK